MRRADLEHIIRAVGAIVGADKIVVIGSQAILGAVPAAPDVLLVSQEADVYPLDDPVLADLIDGSIGEMSPFHERFGYYAHGVSPETATLPDGWRARLIHICGPNTHGVTGLCLHPVDLVVSKLVAGRDRDHAFVRDLFAHGLITRQDVEAVLPELSPEQASLVASRLPK